MPTATSDSAALDVQIVAADDSAWFDQQLADRHYLGAGQPVGDYLRQLVFVRGRPAALLVWGPACYALKDRDRWLGWSATQTSTVNTIVRNQPYGAQPTPPVRCS